MGRRSAPECTRGGHIPPASGPSERHRDSRGCGMENDEGLLLPDAVRKYLDRELWEEYERLRDFDMPLVVVGEPMDSRQARARAQPRPRRRCGRGRGAGQAGLPPGHAARTERQLVPRPARRRGARRRSRRAEPASSVGRAIRSIAAGRAGSMGSAWTVFTWRSPMVWTASIRSASG